MRLSVDDVILSVGEYRDRLYSDIKLANQDRVEKRVKSEDSLATQSADSLQVNPSLNNAKNEPEKREDIFTLKTTPVLLRGSYSPKSAPKLPPAAGKPSAVPQPALSPGE